MFGVAWNEVEGMPRNAVAIVATDFRYDAWRASPSARSTLEGTGRISFDRPARIDGIAGFIKPPGGLTLGGK
jgi:hypothetical protein